MEYVDILNDDKVKDIIGIIEDIKNKGIIEEDYISLSKKLIQDILKINNNLFNKGNANSWACGIIHALGLKNGLFNKANEKWIMVSKLYENFNVSSSTGLSKSKAIRSIIDFNQNEYSKKNIINNDKNIENNNRFENRDIIIDKIEESLPIIELDKNLKEANNLCDIAWKEKNFNKRINLAREALLKTENCSEAYIILSYDNSVSKEEQKEYALKAIKFSEDIIGKENILRYKKNFLNRDFTRTYYSSKYRLGNLLWENNEGNEAIDVFLDLINIYPEDSTLIRLTLMSWMIIKRRFKELEELFEQYKNDFLAGTKYSKALYYFIKGEEDKALRNLRIANSNNSYIMEHLLKIKKIDMKEIVFNRIGSKGEAVNYLRFGEEAWNSVENSREWLKIVKNHL